MPILEYKRNGKTQNDLELHNNRSSASIDDNTTSTDKTLIVAIILLRRLKPWKREKKI